MSRETLRRAAAITLVAGGAASLWGAWVMAGHYAAMTATVRGLECEIVRVATPPSGVEVELRCRNGGTWPFDLVEAQVFAWRNGAYVGAASTDLRRRPLHLAAGDDGQVSLRFPAVAEPRAGSRWQFSFSGRIVLPRVGAETVRFDFAHHEAQT